MLPAVAKTIHWARYQDSPEGTYISPLYRSPSPSYVLGAGVIAGKECTFFLVSFLAIPFLVHFDPIYNHLLFTFAFSCPFSLLFLFFYYYCFWCRMKISCFQTVISRSSPIITPSHGSISWSLTGEWLGRE